VEVVRVARWFFPKRRTPDLLALLRAQADTSERAVESFARWSHGDSAEERTVRDLEHEADDRKRALRAALRAAYFTPLDPEDLYELSERLDTVVNECKDLIREADVMDVGPDEAMGEMADHIRDGVAHLVLALGRVDDGDDAIREADATVSACRDVERTYRKAARDLLQLEPLAEVMARRELYRRYARLAAAVIAVAERVWYSVVKQA
jgi:uncharacterized protein Yka (UPF0111/DUF47 family)